MDTLLDHWNQTFFDGRLSPAVLRILEGHHFEAQDAEVQAFFERYFRFMYIARIDATLFSDRLAVMLGLIPDHLPGRHGGMVPPITFSGRHRTIDAYMACTPWLERNRTVTLLDLGCGFPPLTTLETAERLPQWRIVGADPLLPHYIVHDGHGDHANFDRKGWINWCSAGPDNRYWRDPDATHTHFGRLLYDLLDGWTPGSAPDNGMREKNGARLVVDPVHQYRRGNLSFLHGGIGKLDVANLDLVRCFNVLFYFDRDFRHRTLDWVASILRGGGLFISGLNGDKSAGSRYIVYRREGAGLVEKGFAFSIDNLRSQDGLAWYTLQDDCYETNLLAQIVGVIRADEVFRRDFDARADALLAEHRLFERDDQGYLMYLNPQDMYADVGEDLAAVYAELVREGYVEKAVAALARAGYTARRNCVGHISVAPGAGYKPGEKT